MITRSGAKRRLEFRTQDSCGVGMSNPASAVEVALPPPIEPSQDGETAEPSYKQRVVTPPLETPETTPAANTRASKRLKTMGRKMTVPRKNNSEENTHPTARKSLAFGRHQSDLTFQPNVRLVYSTIRRLTGSIGGNGSFGAIYGELTMGSMQKMVNLMKKHTGLSSSSRFIDVGSGLGKPNLHVAQDPGVEFSYGIEMEHSRWLLSVSNLKAILAESHKQQQKQQRRHSSRKGEHLGYRCMFDHANIQSAESFDPFTHVYMFSIGFPPRLWVHLAEIFNDSKSPYLICYHPPRTIVDSYGFEVELITQTPTSMHGSSEGHMGYIYKRATDKRTTRSSAPVASDPLFERAYATVMGGFGSVVAAVDTHLDALHGGRLTRSKQLSLSMEYEQSSESDEESS